MKRILLYVLPLLMLGFAAMASNAAAQNATSSPGAAAVAQNGPNVINPGATVALITTTTTTGIEALLTAQGIIYDLFFGSVFDAVTVPLAGYNSVIVAMDGGLIEDPSIQNIAAYANGGGNLIMIGGTNYQPFRDSVNLNLLTIDTLAGWVLQANPTWVAVDPAHYLIQGLTLPHNGVGSTNYRMIVNLDPTAIVAANNSVGENAIFNKPLGAGALTWIINSPKDSYWADPADRAALDTVIVNALNPNPVAVPDYSLQFNTFSDCVNLWFDPADGTAHGNIPVYGPGTVFAGLYDRANTMGVGFQYLGATYMYKFTVSTRSVEVFSVDSIGSTKTLINADTWSVAPSCPGPMNAGAGNRAIK